MSVIAPAAGARRRLPDPFGQLARFAVVGASNTAVTFLVSMLAGLAMPAVVAAVVGWSAGAANGYRLNRGWTFASGARGARPAVRYCAVQAVAAAIDAGGVALSHGDVGTSRAVAELIAIPVASAVAFVLCRAWVFAS